MDWVPFIIVGGVVLAFVFLKQRGQISPAAAIAHLKQGARVVDVRSAAEFSSGHLPDALNLPLGDLKARAAGELRDKDQVLLLHCLSGGRSAIGKRVLKGMGYTRVFNLGSYSRAESILRKSAA